MKRAYFIILLLAACQPSQQEQKNSESTAADSSASNLPIPDQLIIADHYTIADFENSWDVLLEPGTPVMSDTTEEATILLETEGLVPVRVITTSNERKTYYDTNCSLYYHYEVQFSDEKTGWVFGEKVMVSYDTERLSGSTITINGNEYVLYFLKDAGIGPSDENGLTGCDQYIIPYFYNAANQSVHFIKNYGLSTNNYFIVPYLGWVSFASSEGGSASISEVSVSENILTLKLDISYQEGGDTVLLDILYADGVFSFENMTSTENSGD